MVTKAEKLKKIYWDDPEKARKYSREKNKQWRIDNPEKQMMKGVRKRCKEKNILFDINYENITIPEYCPIFSQIKLQNGGGDSAPTLDRIDNSKGYMKNNIQVISYRANRIKSDATLEELVKIGKWAENELSNTK